MQFSYRLLTTLYLFVTITQSQLFPGKSEVGGKYFKAFDWVCQNSRLLAQFHWKESNSIHSFHRHQGPPSMPISPNLRVIISSQFQTLCHVQYVRASYVYIYPSPEPNLCPLSPFCKTRGNFWPDEIETLLRLVVFGYRLTMCQLGAVRVSRLVGLRNAFQVSLKKIGLMTI